MNQAAFDFNTIEPLVTSPETVETATKTLLFSDPGWGKTSQCVNYSRMFGQGFVMSGESGLSVLTDAAIPFLPFSSWDGPVDPSQSLYSYRFLCNYIMSRKFREGGYRWLALDSLTEVSDRLMEHLRDKHKDNDNRFEIYSEFARLMIANLKWLRDLPYHILVNAHVRDEQTPNGSVEFWPLVEGKQAFRKIPAIFDNVIAGLRVEHTDEDTGEVTVRRLCVTDGYNGYRCKVRRAGWRAVPIIETDDITSIIARSAS